MIWFLFLAFLFFVRTSTATKACKDFSYSALALTASCRNLKALSCSFKDEELHEQALFVHKHSKGDVMAFRLVYPLIREIYFDYLQRLEVKRVGHGNLKRMVERWTRKNARQYIGEITLVNLPHFAPALSLMRILRRPGTTEDVYKDPILCKYYLSARLALETYASTLCTYQDHTLFPSFGEDITLKECVEKLREYIKTILGTFDYRATYPDAVMCLSVLQYLKYLGLFASNMDLVRTTTQMFRDVRRTLQNEMTFLPHKVITFENYVVHLIPQERKGERKLNASFRKLSDGNLLIQVGIKDFQDIKEVQSLIQSLYQRGILPLS